MLYSTTSVNAVEKAFSMILFSTVLYFVIVAAAYLLIGIDSLESDVPLMQILFTWCTLLSGCIHLGLYCAVGETLSTESEGIRRTAYECTWYSRDPKVARNLTLMLLRAKEPLTITGKIFPLTLALLCSIMKTAAGYVSFLLAKR